MITLESDYLTSFVKENEILNFQKKVNDAHKKLLFNTDSPSEFKDWLNLPENYDRNEIKRIRKAAEKIKKTCDVFIVIGVGGSYLGASSAIDFLKSPNYNFLEKNSPKIFFAGNNLSEYHITEILKICKNKDVCINVISKSGSTLEPAISFNIFKNFLEAKYGKEASKERIFCTTEKGNGNLRKIATEKNYETFEIPKNIGGRFSVLSPVGLLPIAVCGGNIDEILNGAKSAKKTFENTDLSTNDCYKYAVLRNIFYQKNKNVELFCGYEPRLLKFFEWCKQLFGESEGKNGKGLFPASAIFTTDLHSLGQFIQEGSKILFETILKVENSENNLKILPSESNEDNLNFLAKKTISYINEKAFEGVTLAHTEGGIPNIVLKIKDFSEFQLGELFYFFEKACAISAYLLDVDPFNQPGVEAYKKEIVKLLR